jgi:uroporphyrinogen-III decarboxylase
MISPKENLLRAIKRNNPYRVPNGMENVRVIRQPVVEHPAEAGLDAFGVHWSLAIEAEGGTYPTTGGHVIDDIEKWKEKINIPDVSKIDWTDVKEQLSKIDRENFLVEGFVEMGLFERSYLLFGMEEALVLYLTEPELMAEVVTAIADYKIELIKAFHEVAKLDIIWYGDDWGTQSNLFIPPDTWRKIIKPQTQRIYDCMKELGIIINQHSCGKIESIFADLTEMGANMWDPCQPCNDLAMLKRNFGDKISFCGGIDTQFVLDKPGVTLEEVRAEVRKRIDDMAAGGGYIAGPSQALPFDEDILNAMNDEINTYGRAFYNT